MKITIEKLDVGFILTINGESMPVFSREKVIKEIKDILTNKKQT